MRVTLTLLPPTANTPSQPQVNVFFSAHGVPKSYVEEAGDPYKEEMEECVALIMNELRRRGRWVVAEGSCLWLCSQVFSAVRHPSTNSVQHVCW
jgi:protoheme ferro-lyase